MNTTVEQEKFTEKFFDFLHEEGMKTNYQASKKTGISESTLSEVKRGICKLSLRDVLRACEATGHELRFVKIKHSEKKKE